MVLGGELLLMRSMVPGPPSPRFPFTQELTLRPRFPGTSQKTVSWEDWPHHNNALFWQWKGFFKMWAESHTHTHTVNKEQTDSKSFFWV